MWALILQLPGPTSTGSPECTFSFVVLLDLDPTTNRSLEKLCLCFYNTVVEHYSNL